MAGSELQVEGLPGFRVGTLLASSSTPQNSLEAGFQVNTLQNGATAYVLDQDAVYRWVANSVAVPTGNIVIIPQGQLVGTPGRWVLIFTTGPNSMLAFDDLATVNALPVPLSSLYVILGGLGAFNDRDGGTFRVTSGLTADAFNVIDLTGANAGLQLQRVNLRLGALDWAKSGSTVVTISVANTPTLIGGTWVGTGAPPWSFPNPSEFQWNAQETLLSECAVTISGTGTAGDDLEFGLSPTTPAFTGQTGLCTVNAAGRFSCTFNSRFTFPNGLAATLVVANLTFARNVTVSGGGLHVVPVQGSQV